MVVAVEVVVEKGDRVETDCIYVSGLAGVKDRRRCGIRLLEG
jgi:hypothetical protein